MAYLTAVGLNFGRYAVCPLVISMVYTYPPNAVFRALQCGGTEVQPVIQLLKYPPTRTLALIRALESSPGAPQAWGARRGQGGD